MPGGAQVSVVVFIFGFGGFLAAWSGLYVPSGPDDPGNTILFSLLNSQGRQVGSSGLAFQDTELMHVHAPVLAWILTACCMHLCSMP